MFVSPFSLMTMLLALLLPLGCSNAEADVPAPAPAPEVSVAEVIAQPLHEWQELTGRLEGRERVEVRPRVAGYIDSVHFEDGARVRKGQLLFRIDPRPFEAEVERWSGEVERATSQHELARLNHTRGKSLLADRVIAEEAADRLAADEVSARGALKASAASLREARLNQEFTEVRSPRARCSLTSTRTSAPTCAWLPRAPPPEIRTRRACSWRWRTRAAIPTPGASTSWTTRSIRARV
jgi:membrane fusion protein, multidrug efflux system